MSDKTTEDTPKVKKTIQVKPIAEFTEHNDPGRIDVDGWEFSWQNEEQKNRQGWGKHLPVERDTELGAEVTKQFGVSGEQYGGLNAETNRFYLGGELVLAYTSSDIHKDTIAAKEEAANKQLAIVEKETGITRFSVQSPGLKR